LDLHTGSTAAQLLQKLEAVARADVDVEHDDVDRAVCELHARLRKPGGLTDVPAVELQIEPAEHTNGRVVVDDENGVTGRIHAGRQSSRGPYLDPPASRLLLENEK